MRHKTWHQGMTFSFTPRYVGREAEVFYGQMGGMRHRTWHQGIFFSFTPRCLGREKVFRDSALVGSSVSPTFGEHLEPNQASPDL